MDDATHFAGKYRIASTRLPGWDYRSPGYYFVTICTRHFVPHFGEVVDGRVVLSPVGEIVAEEWLKTEKIRPNVSLDEWVIMPDHLHGIIVIHESDSVETPQNVETPRRGVSTPGGGSRGLQPGSLGSIIGQFKSICTKRIRAAGHPAFGWQARFYDHVIRSDESLHEIRRYIRDNPLKWESDINHPEDRFWEGNRRERRERRENF